ncbi:centriolin isoform X2 [Tachysurus fulvidraco]|uniref:centriolin isoform X2 n=1 Tax=Tachysurus fulvidraco TaxID=1234273 RepID=UPI001FEEF42A|nr:centriolin isoform X2 [Tachysurus fulvidraco]
MASMKRISDSHRALPVERLKVSSSVLRSASTPGHSQSQATASEDAAGLSDDDEIKCTGTRYITEDYIKKMTKQDNLSLVHRLNLSTTHGDKYFKYIENLDKCERVQVLNLSNNTIEKIEKLEKLNQLHELHLSNNRIRKIEGLEQMANLQILNLANNSIEKVPLWMGKKLRSLQKLNLQKNKIFSLHELAKLKHLKSLTELMLAENPVSDLPHYRLFIVFHLRSLQFLDGQPISEQEREKAHQRFHSEEVDRLEQELEVRGAEIERLQEEKAAALKELEHQEKLQQSLRQQSQEQQWRQEQLEMELDTKSELFLLDQSSTRSRSTSEAKCHDFLLCHQLKQKTSELTRACQKQYELEQELAFHKIDAKFEPLPYYPNHDLDGDVLGESPYIGKARHKRSTFTSDIIDAGDKNQAFVGLTHTVNAVTVAEERLQQLRKEMDCTEQQILRASEELHQLEEAASQKRISEAEKDHFRQQLHMKIQNLSEMQQEAETLEKQLDRQSSELNVAQGELDQLQSLLHTLNPEDIRQYHVKAQLTSKSQLLSIMSRKQHELEGRLDDMLSRIAKETQEIKDLEQQLTDGQIAANEALKKDLEGIISGLQDYLHGVKDQAQQAQSECLRLQKDNDTLQQLLWDKDQQLSRLQQVAQICENTKEELLQHQEELQTLRRENLELREAQGHVSAYEADLESELQEKDYKVSHLEEELSRLHQLSQLEHSTLHSELLKERQAKENALTQLQLASERELENSDLLQQLNMLQREKGSLMEKVSVLQQDLQTLKRELLCPKQVAKRLQGLKKVIATGSSEISRVNGDEDVLSESFAELQEELHRTVSAALRDRDAAQSAQDRLVNERNILRNRLAHSQEKYQSACEEAQQTRAAEKCEEEAELLHLRQELHEAQEQQYLMLQCLQEVERERDQLFLELGKQDKQIKAEETQAQEQLQTLELELRELRKSFTVADQLTAEQLSTAKDELHSLHSTVQRISQERAEDAEDLEESRVQAAQAMQDLTKAEAEIQGLHKLLQDRVPLSDTDSLSIPDSSFQQQELARLSQVLKRQQVQTKRLRDQLAQALEDNSGNLDELIEEIEALRDTLLQQSNYLSSFVHTTPSSGCWYYVPPYQSHHSLGSQATQDSGLGSRYVPSPDRGKLSRSQQHKEKRPSSSTGYWVYSPHQHELHNYQKRESSYRNSNGESDEEGIRGAHFTSPPGAIIYTVPPDGAHLPPGMVIYAPPVPGLAVGPGAVFYGPPPEGVRLVYGPPPSGLHIPLIPNGTLHCNVPDHLDMIHSSKVADHSLREEQSDSVASKRDLLRLEEQRSELQMELKELQRAVSQLQRHRRLLESSLSHAKEDTVMDEMEVLEKTLFNRRTELREVDRLLSEAEADLKDTRAKTKDTLQHYTEAERKLKERERELEDIKQQAQDSTRQLAHTKQQIRDLQEEVKDLQTCKQDQNSALKQVEKAIAAREAEFQELNRNLKRVTNIMEDRQKERRESQYQEANNFMGFRDSEDILYTRRKELEHLNTQVLLQKEQLSLLGRKLEQWREEEDIVRANVEKHRQSLVEVLRQGEEDTHRLQQHIKELRVDVQSLAAQKGELDSKLSERRRRLAQYKKEEKKIQEKVQDQHAVINKHKAELKHVLDMIQLEKVELERVKVQHNQKLDQLEKSQESLLQVRLELQEAEKEVQEQQADCERHRRLQEQEILTLKEQINVAGTERSSLLEQCTNLETRRLHVQRCQETAEEGVRKAEAELLKLQAELAKLKQEHRHAQSVREEIIRDTTATQKQLEEKSKDLNKLKEDIAHSTDQLEKIRKELEDAQRDQDDFVKQQQHQKAVMQDKIQRRQQRIDKLVQQLKEIEASVERKEMQFERQEERLMIQQQQSSELEELQRRQQTKLKAQLQALEEALSKRVEKMEQVTLSVEKLEEQRCFLLADQQQCALLQDRVAQLEQVLADTEARLHASTEEQREAREELETCHSVWQESLEESECQREHAQALIRHSLTDGDKVQQAELWSQGEENSHMRDIKDTVRSLRAEVQAELDSSLKELQPMITSDMDSDMENHTSAALNTGKAAYSSRDEQWRGEMMREKLRQHEDNLKAQLHRCMFSQQEALSLRRQQTEGSIQGLRRRVDKLDQLLTKSGQEFPYFSDSNIFHKYVCTDTERWQPKRERKCSLSPIRLDWTIPEKDQPDMPSQVH